MTTPSDDRELLISAYLDGDLDAPARAAVEADGELLAAVEATAAVRSLLAERPALDADRRESVLAAALAAFDERDLAATSPAAAAATPRVERSFARARARPRRVGRWLAPVAAAAVAVVGLGVLAATMGGDDDESTADAPARVDEQAATATSAATELMAEAATESAGDATALVADDAGAASVVVISSPAELTAFVADLAGAVPEALQICGHDVLGVATYAGADGDQDVAVYVAEGGDEVVAVDTSTCATVLRAPAP